VQANLLNRVIYLEVWYGEDTELKDKRRVNPDIIVSKNRNFNLYTFLAVLACFMLPYIVYFNSINAPFVFDDKAKIVENPDIKSLVDIGDKLIFSYKDKERTFMSNDPSRPVTYLSFALNYYFGKLQTQGYHIVNILFHCLNTMLVFFFTRKIVSLTYNIYTVIFPIIVALFFGLHPANVNTVAYIFSRSDLLATFFYLLSLLLFLKSIDARSKFYPLSLMCFVLALFSKQIAITLPLIILSFDYLFLSNYSYSQVFRKISYHLPYWVLALVFVLFRYFYFGSIGDLEAGRLIDWFPYFISQFYVILRYIQMLFVPGGYCFDHAIPPASSILELHIFLSIIILGGAIVFIAYKGYIIRSGLSKICIFSLIWFISVLFPTSSFFPTTNTLVENRMYLAEIGFWLGVISIYLSLFRVKVPHDSTLFRNNKLLLVLSINIPSNSRALYNLGLELYERKQFYSARKYYEKAIFFDPNHAKAYNNLGLLLYDLREYENAVTMFGKATEIDPSMGIAFFNLGTIFHQMKNYKKAEMCYMKSLEVKQKYIPAYYNLGKLYHDIGKLREATHYYFMAIHADPLNIKALSNLGNIYFENKDYEGADKYYKEVLKIDLNNVKAHYNRGLIYSALKNHQKSSQCYMKALQIDPRHIDSYNSLGNLFFEQSDYRTAEYYYLKAIEVNPNYLQAHNNLVLVYFNSGLYQKARAELDIALRLSPQNNFLYSNKDLMKILKSVKVK